MILLDSKNIKLTLMYIQEMGRMAAEPKGAAATVPPDLSLVFSPSPPQGTIGCPGRKGAKCLATPILPTPGPPVKKII